MKHKKKSVHALLVEKIKRLIKIEKIIKKL